MQALCYNTNLKYVKFTENFPKYTHDSKMCGEDYSDPGSEIASILRSNATLTCLNLGTLVLSQEDLVPFAAAFSENKTLKSLQFEVPDKRLREERLQSHVYYAENYRADCLSFMKEETKYFGLPPGAVVEEGRRIELAHIASYPYFVLQQRGAY